MVSDELHRVAEARETEQAEQVHYKVSETPPRQQVSTFDETLVDGIAQFVARWTAEKIAPQNERLTGLEEAIAELRTKLDTIAELKGRLDAVLMLLGQGGAKSAEIIELPDWRSRHVG
jgi:hypothetical protein